MKISEKVAYIKGLMAGMEIDTNSGTGKVLAEITDVLSELAADLHETHEQLNAVDEDLSSLEEFVYEDLDGSLDIDDADDDFCTGDCESCDGCDDFLDDEDWEEDTAEYSVTCPECGTEFFIDDSVVEADEVIECPGCGKKIEFYFDEEDLEGEE